jgi:hypothetical protein
MDGFDALHQAETRQGPAASSNNHTTWPQFELKCWAEASSKPELYERFNQLCCHLDLLAVRAQQEPEHVQECREMMLIKAYEALAIFRML